MEKHQGEQDVAIRSLEKRLVEVDHSIDVRLSTIEVDIVHIKQLQIAQSELLNITSKDIKDLIRTINTKSNKE